MKSHVADYATRVYCVRIVPASDAPVVRLTGYPVDLLMSNGELYLAESCNEVSEYNSTSSFTSSSIDLTGVVGLGAISRDDLMSGRYDNARVYFFATSWAAAIEDEEPMGLFFFGAVLTTDDTYSVQLMGAIDVLSQSVKRSFSPTCQWTLFDRTLDGDVPLPSASRCTGPRASPDGPALSDHLVTGAVTSVTDQYTVTDSARTEVDDWFGEGSIRFITGANAGLKPKEIKSFASGVIEVHEAFFYMPSVGDQYEMIPGCRKTIDACKAKWSNSVNFGGQPNIPTSTEYGQIGRGA